MVLLAAEHSCPLRPPRPFPSTGTRIRRKRSQDCPISHIARENVVAHSECGGIVVARCECGGIVVDGVLGVSSCDNVCAGVRLLRPPTQPKANSHLHAEFAVPAGRTRSPSKELRRRCRSFSE